MIRPLVLLRSRCLWVVLPVAAVIPAVKASVPELAAALPAAMASALGPAAVLLVDYS